MRYAIIPARGGSKRLPRKNLAHLDGEALVVRSIRLALDAGCVPWVSTEDDEIAQVAAAHGALVRLRPLVLAGDRISTERVIEDWYRHLPLDERPEVIALLQPSTILVVDGARHVRRAIGLLESDGYDSIAAITVDAHHAFAGRLYPRDRELPEWRPYRPILTRPRTQDVHKRGAENGAFWVFTSEHWEDVGCRQGGDCRAYELAPWDVIDIDDARDLRMAAAAIAAVASSV